MTTSPERPAARRLRLLLAKHPDDSEPAMVGAMDETVWENIDEDAEARYWAVAKAQFGDPPGYEYRETWVEFPASALRAVYDTPKIVGTVSDGD